jgi:hypothetical protein
MMLIMIHSIERLAVQQYARREQALKSATQSVSLGKLGAQELVHPTLLVKPRPQPRRALAVTTRKVGKGWENSSLCDSQYGECDQKSMLPACTIELRCHLLSRHVPLLACDGCREVPTSKHMTDSAYTQTTGSVCSRSDVSAHSSFPLRCPQANTPLHDAAKTGNVEEALRLIGGDADVSAANKVTRTRFVLGVESEGALCAWVAL